MSSSKKVVFYGAGRYAANNIIEWKKDCDVLCFVDKDNSKWGSEIGGVKVCSLEDALRNFPDVDFVITTDTHLKEIYTYLTTRGIDDNRISFIIPREKRLGCIFLDKWLQMDGGKILKPCCYEQGFKQEIHGSLDEEYNKYINKVNEIKKGLKSHTPTSCDGCSMLQEDWWEVEHNIEVLSLASGFKGDVCNCKCIYCDAKLFLESSMDDGNITVLDACSFFSATPKFDIKSLILNDGEFVLNKHRKDILSVCHEKKWAVTLYTNGVYMSEDVADYMRSHKMTVISSLDAGTREAFKEIKGVDGFEKAVNNLAIYSKHCTVVLKYILMKDYNDTMEDVYGFVEVAEEVADSIILSRDLYAINARLSQKEKNIYKTLVQELYHTRALSVDFSEDCIPREDINWVRNLFNKDFGK